MQVIPEDEAHNSIPGISELRSQDQKVISRLVWEVQIDDPDEVRGPGTDEDISCSNAQSGVESLLLGLSSLQHWVKVIPFGSKAERALYFIMRVLALLELYFTPFLIVFDTVFPLRVNPVVTGIDVVFTCLFAIGVLLRLRTSFIDGTDICEVKDPKAIVKCLLKDWTFHCDVISLLAVPLLHFPGFYAYLGLFRLLKLWRLPTDGQRMMLLGARGGDYPQMMVNVLMQIFACTHLYACIWFQAKMFSPLGYGHEWSATTGWAPDVFDLERAEHTALSVPIENRGEDLSNLYWCYARSFRDGAYMLIGWAGPNAISEVELLATSFLGPLSGCFMAYIHGVFVNSIYESNILQAQFSERSAILNDACVDMHLPRSLHTRISRYHGYLSMHHLGLTAQELFAQLSVNLSCEMRMFRMRSVILSTNIFKGLSNRVTLLLVQTCVEQVFSPGDMICRKGELADCMYIILRGTVSVMSDIAGNNILNLMRQHDCFGEICFLKDEMQRTAWIRAETFVVLWRVDKEQFDSLISIHEEMRSQVFSAIVERMKGYGASHELSGISTKFQDLLDREKNDALVGRRGSAVGRRFSVGSRRASLAASDGAASSSSETTPLMSSREEDEGQDKSNVNIQVTSPRTAQGVTMALGGSMAENMRRGSLFMPPAMMRRGSVMGGPAQAASMIRRASIVGGVGDMGTASMPPAGPPIPFSAMLEQFQETSQASKRKSNSNQASPRNSRTSPRLTKIADPGSRETPDNSARASRAMPPVLGSSPRVSRASPRSILSPRPSRAPPETSEGDRSIGGTQPAISPRVSRVPWAKDAGAAKEASETLALAKALVQQVTEQRESLKMEFADLQSRHNAEWQRHHQEVAQAQSNHDLLMSQLKQAEAKQEAMITNLMTQIQHQNQAIVAQSERFNMCWQVQQVQGAKTDRDNEAIKKHLERLEGKMLQQSSIVTTRLDTIIHQLQSGSAGHPYHDMQQNMTKLVESKMEEIAEKFANKTSREPRDSDSNPVTLSNSTLRIKQQMNTIESQLDRAETYWESYQQSAEKVSLQTDTLSIQLDRIEALLLQQQPMGRSAEANQKQQDQQKQI